MENQIHFINGYYAQRVTLSTYQNLPRHNMESKKKATAPGLLDSFKWCILENLSTGVVITLAQGMQ
jgi:hypothetical protein